MCIPILEGVPVSGADGDDIAALARQYGPTVFRAAWRVLGTRAAAEDVQQQVFLRLIESPPRNVESWPAYLTTVSTRLAIDHLRRQRRWRLLAPLWKADEPDGFTRGRCRTRGSQPLHARRAGAAQSPRRVLLCHAASAGPRTGGDRCRTRHFGKPRQCQRASRPQSARSDADPGAKPMNTLDRTLELFASREPDAATVDRSAAQARRAGGGAAGFAHDSARQRVRRAAGWQRARPRRRSPWRCCGCHSAPRRRWPSRRFNSTSATSARCASTSSSA